MEDFLVKVAISFKHGQWRDVRSGSAWSHIFCVFDLSESVGTSSCHGLGQGQQLTAVYNNTGQVEVLNAAFQESVSTVWSSETPLPQFPLSSSLFLSSTLQHNLVMLSVRARISHSWRLLLSTTGDPLNSLCALLCVFVCRFEVGGSRFGYSSHVGGYGWVLCSVQPSILKALVFTLISSIHLSCKLICFHVCLCCVCTNVCEYAEGARVCFVMFCLKSLRRSSGRLNPVTSKQQTFHRRHEYSCVLYFIIRQAVCMGPRLLVRYDKKHLHNWLWKCIALVVKAQVLPLPWNMTVQSGDKLYDDNLKEERDFVPTNTLSNSTGVGTGSQQTVLHE